MPYSVWQKNPVPRSNKAQEIHSSDLQELGGYFNLSRVNRGTRQAPQQFSKTMYFNCFKLLISLLLSKAEAGYLKRLSIQAIDMKSVSTST